MSAGVGAQEVKALRERTRAPMMDCKRALEDADGDLDRAVELLRVQGKAQAARREARAATEGAVESYLHTTGKIGVLVEVDCETDFVARNQDFRDFVRDVAMHIAWTAPAYLAEDDVPVEARTAELRIFEQQAADRPEHLRAQVAEGRLRKWLNETVLLNQPHVNVEKHGGKTIEELRAETAAKTGENVVIRRFARFEVGAE